MEMSSGTEALGAAGDQEREEEEERRGGGRQLTWVKSKDWWLKGCLGNNNNV